MWETYDAASKQEEGSQTVKSGHDHFGDGCEPHGGKSNDSDEESESASECTISSGSRDRSYLLPVGRAN